MSAPVSSKPALARAQVQHLEHGVGDRETAARQAVERHRPTSPRPGRCRTDCPTRRMRPSVVITRPRCGAHERDARHLESPVPDRARNREAHAPCGRRDQWLVAGPGQHAGAAEHDLWAMPADPAIDRIEFEREPGRLTHALDDAFLVAGQHLDREPECADAEREQQGSQPGEAGDPAHNRCILVFQALMRGLANQEVFRDWTSASKGVVPAAHAACQRRTPAASSSAAVSNSGKPITPEKLPSRRSTKTAPKPLDGIATRLAGRLPARPVAPPLRSIDRAERDVARGEDPSKAAFVPEADGRQHGVPAPGKRREHRDTFRLVGGLAEDPPIEHDGRVGGQHRAVRPGPSSLSTTACALPAARRARSRPASRPAARRFVDVGADDAMPHADLRAGAGCGARTPRRGQCVS